MSDITQPQGLWLRRHEVQILDLRERWEYEHLTIEGARHVPLGELLHGQVAMDLHKPLVLVCRDGSNSELAATMLQVRGLDAHPLLGGMAAWETAGFPLVRPGASDSRVAL